MTNEEAIKWLKVFEENEGHYPEGMDYAEFFDKVAEAIQRAIDVMGEIEREPHECFNCQYYEEVTISSACFECIEIDRGGSNWKRRTSK